MPSSSSEDCDSSHEDHSSGATSRDDDESDSDDNSSSEYSDSSSFDPLSFALDALIDSVVDYEDPNECWDHVRTWLQEHSVEETKGAVELKGEFDTTALHVACRNRPPADVVDIMLMASPEMIYWADSFGWLPVSTIPAISTSSLPWRLGYEIS